MTLQESGEMYLETILVLSRSNSFVRSLDVAEYMKFSKPSVSRAIKLLRENGYVMMDRDGALTLTSSGLATAEKIYERHTILTQVLRTLGVSEETASEDACKIEHDISDETFEAIKSYIEQR